MYLAHFRLDREPFSLTPDPRFLFLSERHREALAHLLYGLEERGGFIQLTGEVGAGKTTLCRSVLDTAPAGVDVALILNPRLTLIPYKKGSRDYSPEEHLEIVIGHIQLHLKDVKAAH